MAEVEILSKTDKADGWEFAVRIGETDFRVTLKKQYWQKLTSEKIPPEDLVKRSFQFLLNREPEESILRSFDLSVIKSYFSDYEQQILN